MAETTKADPKADPRNPGQANKEVVHDRNAERAEDRSVKKDKPADEQPEEDKDWGVVAERQAKRLVNKESNKFKREDGSVIDATPEGYADPANEPVLEKAPRNPVTKAYKADFPYRNESEQNAAPTQELPKDQQ
jgi:hypothetical protein